MTSKRAFKKPTARWIIIGGIAALLLAGALTYFIGNTTKAPAGDLEQQVTLEGKIACLTHKNEDGPHTLECAIGFKANSGKTYALQFDSTDLSLSSAAGSDKDVRITGTLVNDTDTKYKTDGKLRVDHFEFVK
jgi:hypothetical protein